MDRIGHFMQTVSGRAFYPEDPRPEDIVIEDVAHGLSMICRFGGQIEEFYSVAEHAVRVARAIEAAGGTPMEVFWGLNHDNAEAYIGDMVWPLKRAPSLAGYKIIERRIEDAIADRFGMPREMPPIVKHFDLVLLATEKRDIASQHAGGTSRQRGEVTKEATAAKKDLGAWHCDVVAPLPEPIIPWRQQFAKHVFLRNFERLRAAL